MYATSTIGVAFEWLLALTLLLFIAVVASLAVTALRFKNAVMIDAKKIYTRPLQSVKNLAAAGKGVAQQEAIRGKHIGGIVKTIAGTVRVTAMEVKEAATSIPISDVKTLLANAQNAMKIVTLAVQFARSLGKQGAGEI